MRDLATEYEKRRLHLKQVAEALEHRAREALRGTPHIDRVAFRVKDVGSFLAKAVPVSGACRYEAPLAEVEDQVAGRIIVFFTADLPLVRETLLQLFVPIEVTSRRPERDQEFGYQSEHLIMMIPPWAKPKVWSQLAEPPQTFELQLRTLFMHAYAEPQHDLQYKSASELSADARRELAWIAASAWGADAAYDRVRTSLTKSPPLTQLLGQVKDRDE